MLKIKILFLVSTIMLLCACGIFVTTIAETAEANGAVNFSRPVHVSEVSNEDYGDYLANVQKKENITPPKTQKIHGITKTLIIVLIISLLLPIMLATFLLKKFNSMIKNVQKLDDSGSYRIKDTLEQLDKLQKQYKDAFRIEDIASTHEELMQDINSLVDEISKEDLENIEIIPIKPRKKGNNTKQENPPPLNSYQTKNQQPKKQELSEKYIQKEQKRPIQQIVEPKLITQQPISKTKGFYLVDCGKQKALIGYIDNEIFILNKFNNLLNQKIQVRLTEKNKENDIYMVKNGDYKALVQVENTKMKVLLEM